MRRARAAIVRLLVALPCVWPAAAQYVGSAACKQCHPTEYRDQSGSPHAHALAPAPAGSPGQWAFGAGVKAITYVGWTPAGGYVERGRSYYSKTRAFGPTPGHVDGGDLPYPALAAGASAARCFRCHSTGSLRLGADVSIAPAENGVGCEACHGPGAEHIAAGGDSAAIGNPARLNAVELNQFCGTCHRRPPEPDESTEDRIAVASKFDWSNRWNVRHQPAYLSQSACFRASGGKLSCLTCHDPHSAASVPLEDYDRQCAACHKEVKHKAAVVGACASCHMPAVAATPEMQFADHWIGIYGPSAIAPLDSARNPAPLTLPPTAEGKRAFPNDPSTLRPLFEQALAREREHFGAASAEAAHGAWLLGSFLKEAGMPAAAEAPLREALRIDRVIHSPSAAADAMQLAHALQAAGKGGEAIPLFEEAARGSDPRIAAQSWATLAKLDPANAARDYANALAAEEAASGKDSPRVAALLSNLALTLRAAGDWAQAEAMLRRALRIQEAAFGRGHLQSAVTSNNLATVLQNMGKLQEAEALERESLSIFEQKLPNSPELAAAYANLAGLVASRHNGEVEAEMLLRRAIATDQAARGKGTPEEAADLASLASLLRNRDPGAVGTLLKQALAIYEQSFGPASRQAQTIRKLLAELGPASKQ
jgi:hypothetical protein